MAFQSVCDVAGDDGKDPEKADKIILRRSPAPPIRREMEPGMREKADWRVSSTRWLETKRGDGAFPSPPCLTSCS